MADLTPERLAAILWDSRKVSLGDREDDNPFGEASARIQEQYRRFAAEVAKRIDQDRDAEIERLTAGIRDLYTRCMQGARDNGEYYERTAAKYEQGKAVVWDGVAEMLRDLLPAVAETEARRG